MASDWIHYLALQVALKDSNTVDDTSWGREAALNRILGADLVVCVDELDRAATSEGRRERYRASLRRTYLGHIEYFDRQAVLEARDQLRAVKAGVSEKDWALLSEVGGGASYDEIAATIGNTSSGALRVRVQRLRRSLAARLAKAA